MAASIIDQLQKEEVPVLYFFFRQIIDANHQPKAALQDWLCQVLNYSPRLQMKLNDYIEENRALDTLSLSDLWKELKLALASFPKAYCVTDALDEMDLGNDQFLHDLVELGQWRPSNIKVLITSRPVAAVENSLRSISISHIRLEEQLVDNDIAAHVQYKLQHSSVPPECWGTIKNAVPGRANGLFLYAKLSMDAFLEPGADPTEVLRALPTDLNVMYNDLLREHAKRSGVPDDFQRFILQFVTHATRPLRLLEIAQISEAIHARDESGSLKETKDLVRAACGPLLEILPDETVSVAHHSFTEFLKGLTRSSDCDDNYPVLLAGPTNKRLAVACLRYLSSGCLDHSGIKEKFDKNENYSLEHAEGTKLRLQFPFLDYAVENWHVHARRAEQAGMDVFSDYELLDTISAHQQRFVALVAMMWPGGSINCITPLHISAGTGLAGYVGYLLQRESETEMYDSNRETPLSWAAMSGHTDAVQVLLANGAKPNVQGISGFKPLHYAAKKNHAEVVKLLLAAGGDPMTPTHENRRRGYTLRTWHTPLMYACHAGHVEAVSAFLPFLKDVQTCQQVLYWAAVRGQAAVVDLVLQHSGVDVNAKFRGDTALLKACEAGDQKTIDILLRAGADPNLFCAKARDEFTGKGSHRSTRYFGRREGGDLGRFTALHSLCGTFRESLICSNGLQSLLDAGADIHLQDPEGSTPLHYACRANQINLVKTLLEAGADPTAENDAGETPLHTDGAEDMQLLPVLLKSGRVNINKQLRKTGKTPLMCRLEGNKSPLAFLEHKPDVNAMNADGNTGLHIALERRRHPVEDYRKTMVALLSCGANPNLKNRIGDTPLHTMCEDAYELLPMLFQAGADFEARDRAVRTALFKHIGSIQVSRSNPTLFQTLIDLGGARLDTRDFKGRTLLHQCCHQISRLGHMISLGLDPTLTDYEGNTLLFEIAASKLSNISKFAFLKHLCGLGLNIDQANHRGSTVLHTLCARVKNPPTSTCAPLTMSLRFAIIRIPVTLMVFNRCTWLRQSLRSMFTSSLTLGRIYLE
jgi:ankyrin repeat protein